MLSKKQLNQLFIIAKEEESVERRLNWYLSAYDKGKAQQCLEIQEMLERDLRHFSFLLDLVEVN